MQRKIIPDAENRLLILYALKTIGAMTDQQLLIVMTDTDLMNYITLQLTIADLESEGKLRRQGDTSGGTLELTDAGRYLLNSFEMHIPVSRRGLIDSGAAQWREPGLRRNRWRRWRFSTSRTAKKGCTCASSTAETSCWTSLLHCRRANASTASSSAGSSA